MADKPLFLENRAPDGAAALADLLFAGLDERPTWRSFLEACAARCAAGTAAFIFEPMAGAVDDLVIVARGADADTFLLDHPSLEALRTFALGDLAAERAGGRSMLVLPIRLDEARRSYFILQSGDEAMLAADSAALVSALQPLLERVSRHFLTIGNLVRRLSVMETVLESGGVGLVLVGADCGIILTNAVADGILNTGRGLQIVRGRLSAERRADHDVLAARIRDCARKQGPEESHEAWPPLAIEQDGAEHPITVLVRPGPPFAPLTAPLIRTAIVVLRDPARRDFVQPAALERLFHLTPAEARLASLLANGVSVEDAAVQLGVTRNTVRTQLQAVFAKTRTNRQGDLIRLILSTTAVD
jgi:DNA-binding CsgD family transcriptional regulator